MTEKNPLVKRTTPLDENLEPSRTQENSDIIRTTSANTKELKSNNSPAESYTRKETLGLSATVHPTSASFNGGFVSKMHNPVTGFPYANTTSKYVHLQGISPIAGGLYSPITGQNVKVCKMFICTGQRCFRFVNATEEPCKMEENFCELKRTLRQVSWIESKTTWTAGCSADCLHTAPCFSLYKYRCHQECCGASATSCLKLDGYLHVPSNAASVTCLSSLSLEVPLSGTFLTFGLLGLLVHLLS
ncbi:uncharacterized protein LOC121696032 [Alosa sapidissima]|uniref:uncharacterized protein LOC121696032 n=1 Tax=Alosa sapidissima TaxID=34773 RepID=UPI001C093FF5|nr:uncharacterized protein LOC121696032 [Alosa sapidissima]